MISPAPGAGRRARAAAGGPPVVAVVDSYPRVLLGAQRHLLEWLDAWDRSRATPLVLTPADGPLCDEVRARGVRLEVVPYPAALDRYGGRLMAGGAVAKAGRAAAAARYAWGAGRALRRNGVAAVLCDDLRGVLTFGVAAKALGLPLARWVNLADPLGLPDRLEARLCDRLLLIADAMRHRYPPSQVEKYADKFRTILGGIDLDAAAGAAPDRARFGVADDEFVVVTVGSVNRRKGVDRLLAAWAGVPDRLPNARLLIAGAPGASEEERAFADSLRQRTPPHVSFLGPRDDIPALMRSADAFALASRQEGMPRVLQEAMACRLPCVAAGVGGVPEVVADGETGFVVDGDDADEFRDAILRLGADAGLRRRMGEAGRRRAERLFGGETHRTKLLGEIYDLPGLKS